MGPLLPDHGDGGSVWPLRYDGPHPVEGVEKLDSEVHGSQESTEMFHHEAVGAA